MWDLPRPGLEPVSPALAGGFLTAAPPGKPQVEGFCQEKAQEKTEAVKEKRMRKGYHCSD